jgi:hypothetical protein
MRVGDIVKLKPEHFLNEFIKGNCVITEVQKYSNKHRKTRYHIKNAEDCMTWVNLDEVDMVSNLREQRLQKLGI